MVRVEPSGEITTMPVAAPGAPGRDTVPSKTAT